MELLLLKLKEKMIQEFLIKFCIAETPARSIFTNEFKHTRNAF